MLRLEFVNDRTGPDHAANYIVRVSVNGRSIASGSVVGHDRKDTWENLLLRFLEQRGCEQPKEGR